MRFIFAVVLMMWFPSQAGNHALYNFTNAEMTFSKNSIEIVSIASITKLFTAALILEEQLDLLEKVKVQGKVTGRFPIGSMVTRIELMTAMLIASDNRSAETLAYTYPGGYDKFIVDVNEMVGSKNLNNTKIEDASGIKAGNVSTAEDLVNFVYGLRKYPLIVALSSAESSSIEIKRKKKSVTVPLRNTNPDISKYDNILISKTGFTTKAGRCLVMLVVHQNEIYGLAILGEKNTKFRSKVVDKLMNLL